MWNLHIHYIIVHAVQLFQLSRAQYHVIQKSGTEDYITLGSVFRTVTANSASECASLCASTSGCQSSMLMGQSCSLYTLSCTCPGESISSHFSSQYKLFKLPHEISTTAWGDAWEECIRYGMHLLAIHTEAEQQAIEDMMAARGNTW